MLDDVITAEQIKKAGIENVDVLIKGLPFSGNNGDNFILKQDVYIFWTIAKKLKEFVFKNKERGRNGRQDMKEIRAKYINIKEAANRIGCSVLSVRILIEKHDFPVEMKLGKGRLFSPEKIDNYLEKNKELIDSFVKLNTKSSKSESIKKYFKDLNTSCVTGREAAKKIGCNLKILNILIEEHGLPAKKWARGCFIDSVTLENYQEKNKELILSLVGGKIEIEKNIPPVSEEIKQTSLSIPENNDLPIFFKSNAPSIKKTRSGENLSVVSAIDGGCTIKDLSYAVGIKKEEIENLIISGKLESLDNGIFDEQGNKLISIKSAKELIENRKSILISFDEKKGFKKAFDRIAEKRKKSLNEKEQE